MTTDPDWTHGKLPHEIINEAMARDPLHPRVEKCVKKYKRSGTLSEWDYRYLDAVRHNPQSLVLCPSPRFVTRADARSEHPGMV